MRSGIDPFMWLAWVFLSLQLVGLLKSNEADCRSAFISYVISSLYLGHWYNLFSKYRAEQVDRYLLSLAIFLEKAPRSDGIKTERRNQPCVSGPLVDPLYHSALSCGFLCGEVAV